MRAVVVTKSSIEKTSPISEWRQGDFVLGNEAFVFRFDPKNPGAVVTEGGEADGIYSEEEVSGLIVLTQTCDLVKESRRYVEVAPIVAVAPSEAQSVKSKKLPQYAEIPALYSKNFVADLDRVMTLEKGVLLSWSRTEGCRTDDERRAFAKALARKRSRPALPDDFVAFLKKLQERWKDKHDKDSDEGRALRSFREILVQPSPNWDASKVVVRFWLLLDPSFSEIEKFGRKQINLAAQQWFGPTYLKTGGTRFTFDYWIGAYKDVSAYEYVASDPLDYDHLS